MTGFRSPKTVYTLEFVDPQFEGLIVRARASTLGEQLLLAQATNVKEVYENFSQWLVEWNLTDDDDNPVPATYEGMLSQEESFMETIMNAYREARTAVSGPLERPSNGGGQSVVASIPMESLSESQAS